MMKSVILSSPFRCSKKSFLKQNLVSTVTPGPNLRNHCLAELNKQTEEQKQSNMKTEKIISAFPGWLQMEDENDYHVYEDIDLPPSASKSKPVAAKNLQKFAMSSKTTRLLKSCSDSELFHVSSLHDRHEIEISSMTSQRHDDVTFNDCEPEQGFYKCHDNLEDIHEKDLIPDLAPKLLREKQNLLREMSKELDAAFYEEKGSRRRMSLDSGRGGSVVAEEEEAGHLEDGSTIPSRASSMSSGIGSMQSSYSTLTHRQKSWSMLKNEETEFLSTQADETCSISSLSSITSFQDTLKSKNVVADEKIFSFAAKKQLSFLSKSHPQNEAKFVRRKLPAQPKEKICQNVTERENGCPSMSPPPPPLPPRNAPHKKVASNCTVEKSLTMPHKPQSLRLHSARLPVGRRTASKEVAQSVEALHQVSQDLLSLMNGQRNSSAASRLSSPTSLYTPRPRLPSPAPLSSDNISLNESLFQERAEHKFLQSEDILTRSATLPCKRTLNFMDSSILSDQKNMSDDCPNNNNNSNNNNNNTITCFDTPPAEENLKSLEAIEQHLSTVRRSASTATNRRQGSIFKNPLQQRRRSDITSRRNVRKIENIENTPPPMSKATKRRRTIFNISSPFSGKHKSSNASSKVRRTSESKPSQPEDWAVPDEERLPIVLDEVEKQDVQDAIREGLPVIPFFQTPKTGPKQILRSGVRNQVPIRDSMTVRALATPLASRRFVSNKLEDHLILLPPRSKDLLLDGGYFNMAAGCSAKHCQSCTCSKSPKLLFTEDNNDYVQMEARTPNL